MCSYEVTMIDPSQDLNYETVDKLPEVLVPNRLYFICLNKETELYRDSLLKFHLLKES